MNEILQQRWFFVSPPDEIIFNQFSENAGIGAFLIFNYFQNFSICLIYAKVSEKEKKIFSIRKDGNCYYLDDDKGNSLFSKDQTDFITFIKTISFTSFYDNSGQRFLKSLFLDFSPDYSNNGNLKPQSEFDEILFTLKSKHKLIMKEQIGSGVFGKVFKAEFKGKPVVVKILKQSFDHTILREYSSHR